jgi:hypothetical protein
MISYDNGLDYEDNEHFTIGVYTDFKKAVQEIESRGYVRDKNDANNFIKLDGIYDREIYIKEVKINVIFNDQLM